MSRSISASLEACRARLQGVSDDTQALADDANLILAEADKFHVDFVAAARKLASESNLESSLSEGDSRPPPANAAAIDGVRSSEPSGAKIGSVVWSTGYGFDEGWVKLPSLDVTGAPLQQRAV
jgi:putative flavoprotein involved in K+ transport